MPLDEKEKRGANSHSCLGAQNSRHVRSAVLLDHAECPWSFLD